MNLQETVEAQGHLIDSHIMEQIFDTVVEYNGRFEVEQFRIGRTNGEPSYLRLKVEAPDAGRDASAAGATVRVGMLASGPDRCRTPDRRKRFLRAGRFLFHHQLPDPGPARSALGGRAEPAYGCAGGAGGRPGALPQASRDSRRQPCGGGHERHPRDSRIEGTRPPRLRVHEQWDLFRAASGDGGAADRFAHRADSRLRAENHRSGRPRGGAHRRGKASIGVDPRGIHRRAS